MGGARTLTIVDRSVVRAQKVQRHGSGTKAALHIQRIYRGHCVRREVGVILSIVRHIQAHFRGSVVRRGIARQTAAALAVQSVARGRQARQLTAELEADRQQRLADATRRAELEAARRALQPPPEPEPEDDDEQEQEEEGSEVGEGGEAEEGRRAARTKRSTALAMLFATAADGHTAADVEHIDAALNLVSANARNATRQTALHLASDAGFDEGVGCILAHGADPNLHDKAGRTPLVSANPLSLSLIWFGGADCRGLAGGSAGAGLPPRAPRRGGVAAPRGRPPGRAAPRAQATADGAGD